MRYKVDQSLTGGFDKDKYGSYNDPPPSLRKITEKEFAQSKFFIYSPSWIESRQILREGQPMLGLWMYWYHDDTGIGMAEDFWSGKVQYYAFGCAHEWGGEFTSEERDGLPRGRCVHSYKCKKCGWIESVDSSD